MIDVRDLRFGYPDGRIALDGVTLHVAAGESVGLIGPNGAGKTTLFLCLCGVLRCRPGLIRVAGADPADAAQRKQLPAHLGVVFQNSDDQLFSSTVGDDVAFGPLNLRPRDQRSAETSERIARSRRHERPGRARAVSLVGRRKTAGGDRRSAGHAP